MSRSVRQSARLPNVGGPVVVGGVGAAVVAITNEGGISFDFVVVFGFARFCLVVVFRFAASTLDVPHAANPRTDTHIELTRKIAAHR
jgi:hypothetical protein